jgi:molecular chaperone GrpE (heat shock protein)
LPDKLHREIRKLEVRIEDYLKKNDHLSKELRNYLNHLKTLNENIEKASSNLMKDKLNALQSLNNIFNSISESEHAKTHLLESFGEIILRIEEEFQRI